MLEVFILLNSWSIKEVFNSFILVLLYTLFDSFHNFSKVYYTTINNNSNNNNKSVIYTAKYPISIAASINKRKSVYEYFNRNIHLCYWGQLFEATRA